MKARLNSIIIMLLVISTIYLAFNYRHMKEKKILSNRVKTCNNYSDNNRCSEFVNCLDYSEIKCDTLRKKKMEMKLNDCRKWNRSEPLNKHKINIVRVSFISNDKAEVIVKDSWSTNSKEKWIKNNGTWRLGENTLYYKEGKWVDKFEYFISDPKLRDKKRKWWNTLINDMKNEDRECALSENKTNH